VAELGRQISIDYAGSKLVAVVVLRGGFIFAGDLVRQMDPDLGLRVDFVAASSYGNQTTSSGRVEIRPEIQLGVTGRPILIIEDIVETGRTLKALRDSILAQGAESVNVVSLLLKEHRQVEDLTIKYIGFSIPDVFVVGYGLDFAQMYRHFSDIRRLETTDPVSIQDQPKL
jgi:hypoxanthine phosphoribosyltransferase